MFIDKVRQIKSFSVTSMWKKYWKGKDPVTVIAEK